MSAEVTSSFSKTAMTLEGSYIPICGIQIDGQAVTVAVEGAGVVVIRRTDHDGC